KQHVTSSPVTQVQRLHSGPTSRPQYDTNTRDQPAKAVTHRDFRMMSVIAEPLDKAFRTRFRACNRELLVDQATRDLLTNRARCREPQPRHASVRRGTHEE